MIRIKTFYIEGRKSLIYFNQHIPYLEETQGNVSDDASECYDIMYGLKQTMKKTNK